MVLLLHPSLVATHVYNSERFEVPIGRVEWGGGGTCGEPCCVVSRFHFRFTLDVCETREERRDVTLLCLPNGVPS